MIPLVGSGDYSANAIGDQDDATLVKDMPVSVQIVGGKFGEEKAVSVAQALEEALAL